MAVAVLALGGLVAMTFGAADVTWRWAFVPFAVAVVVTAATMASVRVPHNREWNRVGAQSFAVAAFLAFGPVPAALATLVYCLARVLIDTVHRDRQPAASYLFRAGRVVLGFVVGGVAAGLVVDQPISTPGDSDLAVLVPFVVGYLVVQIVAFGGLHAHGEPAWDRRTGGRLASLGLPAMVQAVVWETLGVLIATTVALVIDTVGLRLAYWLACLLALAIMVWANRTLDRDVLVRERNRDLNRALSELRTLNDVSQMLTATYEPTALVEELGRRVGRLTRADAVVIARLDPIRGRIRFNYASHGGIRQPERYEALSDATTSGPDRMTTGDALAGIGIVGRSIQAGQTVVGTDTESHPLVRQDGTFLPLDRAGVRHFHSAVAVPLWVGGELIGVLAVKSHRPGMFDVARVSLLERIAGQAAMAIRNAEIIAADRASDVARQDFLAVVSHELRTPITTISGYAQLLARRINRDQPASPDPEAMGSRQAPREAEARMVDVIVRQSRHLGRLIDDLVLLSGLGRGETRLDLRTVDLVTVAREAVDAARFARPDRAALSLEADGRVLVDGDPIRLRQVFDNLLVRVAGPSATGQPVAVRVGIVGSSAEIRVTDRDRDLGDADRARVFEPFHRVDGDDSVATEGLGLELSIVREIVISHGGDIAVESAPGEGTTYVIRLVLAETTNEPPPSARDPRDSGTSSPVTRPGSGE